MHTSMIASMPWTQEPDHNRSSFASRVSGFFGRRNESASFAQSPRATTTFEVPLFLSPTRYDPRGDRGGVSPRRGSVRSASPESDNMTEWSQPSNPPALSVYSGSELTEPLTRNAPTAEESPTETSRSSQSRSRNKSRKTRKRQVQHRRRRKTSITQQLRTAKHLALAFGITFLLAAITYLVLAATGIAAGTVFHVIFVLLLLVLFGVFLHSCCRWFIFSRKRKEKRKHKMRQRQWFGHTDIDIDIERADHNELDKEAAPEQPIPIIMKEDEITGGALYGSVDKIQHPPPTYGNVRESKRMDPSLVHWKKVPPSPLTPTYAEAMNDVQRVVGYRPPSYAESDGDATRIIERQRMDIDGSLQHIHPLHRDM